MKKKKIISAVSAVALAVSSLVPLSANAYEVAEKIAPDNLREDANWYYSYNWIKQDENDHMGFSPLINEMPNGGGWLCNIKFTTADGSILTKADFPEYGGEESIYFDVTYEDGVHTMSFRSSYCFLYSAQLDVLKRTRSLSLRKNFENVEATRGKFIQYAEDYYKMRWDNGLIYKIAVPKDSDYIPTTEDFKGIDINRIEAIDFTYSDGRKEYNIYTNATEEELAEDYLLSNAYVDNQLKLEEIQKQSGKFEIEGIALFLDGGAGIGTVPEDDAGDFNADGEIDVRDFFTLSQFIAEVDKETISADQADVNRDGVADVSDLLTIAQYIVKQ